MLWKYDADATAPVITAETHVRSGHVAWDGVPLPPRAVVFLLGRGIGCLREHYATHALLAELPRFLGAGHAACYGVAGRDGVCFLHGGYGAPQAVDTLETMRAMGVKELLAVGLCGAFAEDLAVGDVILPAAAYSEEGASRHYYENTDRFFPDAALFHALARAFPEAKPRSIVTTDAVYRQTLFKEALWREEGCAAVDMETSALFSVAAYYGMRAASVLMVSDRHPVSPTDAPWLWTAPDFRRRRESFIRKCVDWSLAG